MTTKVDPIFAAIAAHKHAVVDYEIALEADKHHPGSVSPADKELDHQQDAVVEMLQTEPTTVAGALALLKYLGEDVYTDNDDWTVFTYALGLHDDGSASGGTEWLRRLPATLAATLRRLIAAEAREQSST